MKKSTVNAFILFNVVYFLFLYLLIPIFPRFLIFGFLSSHFCAYIAAMVIASFVWGAYFKRYYDYQDKKPPIE